MHKRILWLFFILALIIATLSIPSQQALVFEQENTSKILTYVPLDQDSTFQIKYTHSIHLSDVLESYKVNPDGEIQLYELEYEDFSIGMPANAEEGETFVEKEGKYHILNMNRTFSFFDLRVGQVKANHCIVYKQKIHPLSQSIQPGTWVRIKIRELNLLQQLKGVNMFDS